MGSRTAPLKTGLVHGGDGGPIQACSDGQACVFGDHAFGDTQSGGDLLVGLLAFEFETQGVFEFAHVDPWGGHSGPAKRTDANPAEI